MHPYEADTASNSKPVQTIIIHSGKQRLVKCSGGFERAGIGVNFTTDQTIKNHKKMP